MSLSDFIVKDGFVEVIIRDDVKAAIKELKDFVIDEPNNTDTSEDACLLIRAKMEEIFGDKLV